MYCFWTKKIFLEKDKKYLAHLHKHLKASHLLKVSCLARDNLCLWRSQCARIQYSLLWMRLAAVRKSQSLTSKWNFGSNTAIPLKMKFIPKLWGERADRKHVNNRSRLVSAPGANYYNGCQTSNVWRRNMSRSRESRPRESRKQQTKITFAARARTLNRF